LRRYIKAGVTPAAASAIAAALASLESLDTPAVCGHHVEQAYAVRGALASVAGWRLPAAVVAAQPACGVGVMGRSCSYICPAEWTKGASLESQGKAVQIEQMKFMLKAPGTKRLKVKYDKPLSNFAL